MSADMIDRPDGGDDLPPITEAEIAAFSDELDGIDVPFTIRDGFLVAPSRGIFINLSAVEAVASSDDGWALVQFRSGGQMELKIAATGLAGAFADAMNGAPSTTPTH